MFPPRINFTSLASRQRRYYYETAMSKLDTLFDNDLVKIIGEKPSPSRFSHRSDLQKEPIGENTKFLYYIYKDEAGYHSDWAWSENTNDLIEFLFDYLIARAMVKETGADDTRSDGLETHSLQESLLLVLVDAIKNRNLDPNTGVISMWLFPSSWNLPTKAMILISPPRTSWISLPPSSIASLGPSSTPLMRRKPL